MTVIADVLRLLERVEGLNIPLTEHVQGSLQYSALILIFIGFVKFGRDNRSVQHVDVAIWLWIIWSVFGLVRGLMYADGYFDYKYVLMTAVPFAGITLLAFLGRDINRIFILARFYLRYICIPAFLLIPLSFVTGEDLFARSLIGIGFLVVFIPYMTRTDRTLIIFLVAASIITAPDFRANLLRIFGSFGILGACYFNLFPRKVMHALFFAIPIVLMGFAWFGNFNIFDRVAQIEGYEISVRDQEVNLASDTRSFLYKEVIGSIEGTGQWLFGKGASGAYESMWFYNEGGAHEGIRRRSEVNILNILLYHGLVGVILYTAVMWTASWWAVYRSSNMLANMIGLVVAFRWSLSFVEEFTQYNMNFFFLWLLVGLISTKRFIAPSQRINEAAPSTQQPI